jgi:class 3 adenylate cyclase
VIERGAPSAVAHVEPDGTRVYELYVPLLDAGGRVQAVFELYEPIDRLNAILARAAIAPLVVPGVLMAALLAALWHLVGRAQGEIDARTAAMRELRRRIETFVSSSAKDAARGAGAGGAIPSRRVRLCLLYSDVRDFTGFAEDHPPEAVVGFLNRLMTIQVRAVRERGGDVDKLIGDALLARFDGADAPRRAVEAAEAILRQCAAADLPRRVGIGIHAGEVVSGAIGPEERRDFTVIGDGVNVAARLCAAAAAGEIVADAAVAAACGGRGFGPAETLRVKGRHEPLSARRWRG